MLLEKLDMKFPVHTEACHEILLKFLKAVWTTSKKHWRPFGKGLRVLETFSAHFSAWKIHEKSLKANKRQQLLGQLPNFLSNIRQLRSELHEASVLLSVTPFIKTCNNYNVKLAKILQFVESLNLFWSASNFCKKWHHYHAHWTLSKRNF
jgi:hypothetical protein